MRDVFLFSFSNSLAYLFCCWFIHLFRFIFLFVQLIQLPKQWYMNIKTLLEKSLVIRILKKLHVQSNQNTLQKKKKLSFTLKNSWSSNRATFASVAHYTLYNIQSCWQLHRNFIFWQRFVLCVDEKIQFIYKT